MQLNKQLLSLLINHKSNNINKLDIYIGKLEINYNKNKLFSKNISKYNYDQIINKFLKYKFTNYKEQLYRYSNNYLSIKNKTKTHYNKINFKNFSHDKYLFLVYSQNEVTYTDFTCKKEYHITNNNFTKFIINNEISILFIENKNKFNIKLEIIVDHNIDLTIKTLESINI